jgi:hypothetical protein
MNFNSIRWGKGSIHLPNPGNFVLRTYNLLNFCFEYTEEPYAIYLFGSTIHRRLRKNPNDIDVLCVGRTSKINEAHPTLTSVTPHENTYGGVVGWDNERIGGLHIFFYSPNQFFDEYKNPGKLPNIVMKEGVLIAKSEICTCRQCGCTTELPNTDIQNNFTIEWNYSNCFVKRL